MTKDDRTKEFRRETADRDYLSQPNITDEERQMIENWVENGGSLFFRNTGMYDSGDLS